MAHLWLRAPNCGWATFALASPSYTLRVQETGISIARSSRSDDSEPMVLRTDSVRPECWALMAKAGDSSIALNGRPLLAGLSVLKDRDEIRLFHSGRIYFSTERLPAIEPFSRRNGDEAIYCPRCRQEIEQGTDAVQCPRCSLFYHASEDRGCWDYSPSCTCGRATDLDAGYEWTPHDL